MSVERDTKRMRYGRWGGALALAAAMGATPTAHAINIQLVYDDLGENPDYDLDGTRLMAVASAAAQIWEDLLPQAGNYTIDVSWSQLSGNQLGLWKADVGNDNTYFDTDRDWFIDSTPLSHDEFDFGNPFDLSDQVGSVLAGHDDNSPLYFNGDPPDSLEIAYRGIAKAGQGATGVYDLLSVVVHEFGHELGVNDDPFSTVYPVYPQHVLGVADLEIRGADDVDEEEGDGGHLGLPYSSMSGFGLGTDQRRLPSASDVLAAAWDESFTTVDLDRKHIGRSGDWNTASNWIGGSLPNFDDDAYLVDNRTVTMSDVARARNLFIGRSASLATGDNTLEVSGLTSLDECALCLGAPFTRLFVQAGGVADLTNLDMRNRAQLELSGGTLVIGGTANVGFNESDEDVLDRGYIFGFGTITVGGLMHIADGTRGKVEAIGGTLRLDGDGVLDLDGVLRATSGNIELGTRIASGSTGDIEIFGGNDLVVLEDMALQAELTLGNGTAVIGADATVDVRFTDRVHVETNTSASIQTAGAVFLSRDTGSHLISGTLALDSTNTHFRGVNFGGSGVLRQQGDITVGIEDETADTGFTGAVTTIDTDTFDWGNSTAFEQNDLRILAGATLVINANDTGTTGNGYRGDIFVNSGTLEVNFDDGWALSADPPAPLLAPGGRLFLQNTGNGTPTLRGSTLTVHNFMTASGGQVNILAPLVVAPGGVVNVQTGAEMQWRAPVTLAGGDVNGAGRIEQLDDITVTEDSVISPGEFGWGLVGGLLSPASTLAIEDGASLTIYAGTGVAGNAYRGIIALNGGRLQYFTGEGWTLPAPVPGSIPLLSQRGGQLIMNRQNGFSSSVAGDKVSVHGRIRVTDPNAEFDADADIYGDAIIDVQTGGELWFNETTTFNGGTIGGPGTLGQGGDMVFADDTVIDTATFDWGNSNVIEDHAIDVKQGVTLTINSTSLGAPGNPFNGTMRVDRGTLIVNTPDGWTLPNAGGTLDSGVLQLLGSGAEGARLAGADLSVVNHLIASGGSSTIDNHVTIQNGGRLSLLTTTTLRVTDELTFIPGAIAQGSGRISVLSTGTLNGGGDVGVDLNLSGTLAPSLGGLEPGIGHLAFGDDLVMLPSARLEIDLGATDYDTVRVSDSAFLSGTLAIALGGGFMPTTGTSFDIFFAEGLQGSFDTALFPLLTLGLAWQLDYLFDIDAAGLDVVRVSVIGTPVPLPPFVWAPVVVLASFARRRGCGR